MFLLQKIIEIIDNQIIRYLLPLILSLQIIEFIYRGRYETKKVLQIVSAVLVGFALLQWIELSVPIYEQGFGIFTNSSASEQYDSIYLTLQICALVLPFLLLINGASQRFWIVLLLAFCSKLGLYMEFFIIYTTTLGRAISTKDFSAGPLFFLLPLIFLAVGMVMAIASLGFFEEWKKQNKKSDS